jgi:aspartyl-tRNA(Asn)/glutamyl-tRNA(Gln) amidotransferase subunit C
MTDDDVRKLALLARLRLTDAEIQHLGPQLSQILEFVDQLSNLETEGVEPMTTALDVVNRWAVDEVRPGLDREQALENAPRHDETFFLVPPVLGQTSK